MDFTKKEILITPNMRWALIPDQFIWHLQYYHTMLPNAKLTLDRNGLPVPEPLKEKKISWFG